ncbi:hypothetical protein NQ317_011942 [Molorchus minor]|uniref:RNase H type-1 domain-containing protein n=1 Tax=Molorchus minor TaxID=1323400 RepID=A0ABQ9JE02_9CUCU|nr:hypothetical protein NQ317_011942 [Molorchus minor]
MPRTQAALKALVSYRCNSKTVWNCQKALNNLSLRNHVTLVWIPGQSGQEGNEIADSLARKGAETTFIGPEPVLGISYNTAKMAVLNWSEGEILRYWQSLPELKQERVDACEELFQYVSKGDAFLTRSVTAEVLDVLSST